MKELDYFLLFFIYSFIGWISETVYCSNSKKVYNRGFCFGPLCPIYGFGAISILLITRYIPRNIFLIFILGVTLPTMIEYITSYLLEKMFKLKWWDYSRYKYNLKGRVCLLNSLLFGIGSVMVIYVINPLCIKFLFLFNDMTKKISFISISIFYALDIIFTIKKLYIIEKTK